MFLTIQHPALVLSRLPAALRNALLVPLMVLLTVSLSQYASADTDAQLAQLTAEIRANYPESKLGDPANRATVEAAREFVKALVPVVDEQIKLYSDGNSAAFKAAQNTNTMPPEAVLYANLTCQKALAHFPAMLDAATATAEDAALFWYGSQQCMNTSTSAFIRTQQSGGRAYEQVKKYISDLAGGLNPADFRHQLPNATLQTLIEFAGARIDEPSRALAAKTYRQQTAGGRTAAAAVPPVTAPTGEQFSPSISLLPAPSTYDEAVVGLVAEYLLEVQADLKTRGVRKRLHSSCQPIYTQAPATLVATNEFYVHLKTCSLAVMGLGGDPKLTSYYQNAITDLQAFTKAYKPVLP